MQMLNLSGESEVDFLREVENLLDGYSQPAVLECSVILEEERM